ncbi:MAG: hypothetical protein PVH96_14295 [Gemmatimonadota bacterium]|jgi:hypothetical protein
MRQSKLGRASIAVAIWGVAMAGARTPTQAQGIGDQARLEAVLVQVESGNVSIEQLEAIPATAESQELRSIVGDLVRAREQLQVLRDRYSDDYPPIQDLLSTIEAIETRAIPTVVRGLVATQRSRDRARLEAVLVEVDSGNVSIEQLEAIPVAAESAELRSILRDLVQAREELRVLRDRYSDDYPPIQDLLSTIEAIETRAIPTVVRGLIANLSATNGA